MDNKIKKEINTCVSSIKDNQDMQSVCRLHELTGGSDNYYPTIIDGKVKIYMNNYYIDILLDVSFGENAMIISYDGTTTLFVKVT